MEMYIIETQEDLNGKTIKDAMLFGYMLSHCHMQILITEDRGILMAAINYDNNNDDYDMDDDMDFTVLPIHAARARYLMANDAQVRQNLHCLGITNEEIDEFAADEAKVRALFIEREHQKFLKEQYLAAKKTIAEYEGHK
jgi:hypothetical protein